VRLRVARSWQGLRGAGEEHSPMRRLPLPAHGSPISGEIPATTEVWPTRTDRPQPSREVDSRPTSSGFYWGSVS
jgi:hypothetical protein